jgi:hypothetical protein
VTLPFGFESPSDGWAVAHLAAVRHVDLVDEQAVDEQVVTTAALGCRPELPFARSEES